MDVLTFIAQMVQALAWPLVGLVIAVLFRKELRALSLRVRKGKVGPAEFEFEEAVAALGDRVRREDGAKSDAPLDLVRRADSDPRSVILGTWLAVERTVERVVATRATDDDRRDPRLTSLKVLHRVLHDKPDYVDVYNELRSLRNRAVHDRDFAPRPSSVVEYVGLADELIGVLRPFAE